MPFVEKPVAFDSVDFLPGFPSLSVYGCNPWNRDLRAGACASPPSVVGREKAQLPATVAMSRAMLEAGIGPASFMSEMQRGIVPAALSGCGCGGSCGGCGDDHGGMGAYGLPDFSAVASDPFGYITSNLFPIALGAALVFMLKRK